MYYYLIDVVVVNVRIIEIKLGSRKQTWMLD
jgi:hypothetical protein